MIRLVLVLVAGIVAVGLKTDRERAVDIEMEPVDTRQVNVSEISSASPNVGTVVFSTNVSQQSVELIQLGSPDAP